MFSIFCYKNIFQYDELIPEELEADRGGFYINSGSLEFKKLSNFERPGDEIRMPKAKKRALSTSSESSAAEESAAGQDKNSEKLKKNTHTEKKVKTAAATSSSDEQGKAKKQKKEKLDKQEKIEKPKEVVPKDAPPAKEPEKKKPVEKIPEPEKILKTTTVKDMLRAKRDHMRKMEQGKPTSSGATTATENDDEEDGEIESLSSLAISDSSRDSHPDQPPTNGVKDVQLPSTLPADIISAIGSLKQTAETSKTNFFNTAVLDQLVILDNSVKAISMTSRVQVFNYLEQFVPCTKKTLFAKVRKHRVHQFEIKVKSEVHKLRKVVNDLMPEIKAKYDSELSRYEECKNIQNVIGTDFQLVVPRIKFHWNDEARVALSEITRHLKDRFKCSKKSKETEQDFLVRRMRSDIIPLWPDGWMRLEDLNREVERKKKKDARATAIATQESPQPNLQTKNNTNSATEATNGKSQAQKTEPNTKTSEVEATSKVWTATTQKIPTPSASPSSVIKRSSDHSINSIISASPSPPNTSQSIKTQESASKPRMVDIEKLICPSDLLKTVHQKPSLPRFNFSPIESDKLKAEKVRRSDSSDSDCVEIVGEFSPIKPVKYNQVNHSLPEPFAKKSKKHGSDDGEHETDYSKIIMGLQSLTVRIFFSSYDSNSNSFLYCLNV